MESKQEDDNKDKQSDNDDEESEEEMPQEDLDINLLTACKDDNVEEAQEWLDRKANPLWTKDGWNAVLWAACNGNDKLIRILHQRGATIFYLQENAYM